MKKVTLVVKNGRNHMCAYVCACVYMLMYATHSSTLDWKIPWMEEPGRLQSMGCKELDMTKQLHFLSYVLYICTCVLYMYMWCVYVCMYVYTYGVYVSL